MSNRLNQEREKLLQPKRIETGLSELKKLGMEIISVDDTKIVFRFKGHPIQFFPYSGWHSGKTIEDGRGLQNLLRQLTQEPTSR